MSADGCSRPHRFLTRSSLARAELRGVLANLFQQIISSAKPISAWYMCVELEVFCQPHYFLHTQGLRCREGHDGLQRYPDYWYSPQ